jgi:hypothetical protein
MGGSKKIPSRLPRSEMEEPSLSVAPDSAPPKEQTDLESFRAEYRQHLVPSRYSGRLHVVTTFGVLGAGMLTALSRLDDVEPWAWAMIPTTLLAANAFEYLFHRYPLHRQYRLFAPIYHIHTRQHHRFFTRTAMIHGGLQDYRMVLFPYWAPFFALFLGFLPLAWVVSLGLGLNSALLFYGTASFAFIFYEFMHLSYHRKPGRFLGRSKVMAFLTRHHALHHDLRWAGHNLNVTIPLCDWLLGSLYSPSAQEEGLER